MGEIRLVLIFVLVALIVSQLVDATVIEISTDNTTWKNYTLYGGTIDEINRSAIVTMLKSGSSYYARGMNDTHDWGYTVISTEDINESDQYYLYAIILCFFIVLLIFGYHLNDYPFLIFAGTLCILMALHVFNNPFLNLTNPFFKNGLVMVIAGIGMYYVVAPSVKIIEEGGI